MLELISGFFFLCSWRCFIFHFSSDGEEREEEEGGMMMLLLLLF